MLSPLFRQSRQQYTLVDGGGEVKRALKKRLPSIQVLSLLCLIIATTVASFLAGKYSTDNRPIGTVKLPSVSYVFRYNRTFGERPSLQSDRAWRNLFPEQNGFFKHPTIAPERSAFSVFHQLHCLNGIRLGYWTVHDAAITGQKLNTDDLPMMSSPSHIRHCIDLLRNALICQPDTTVEVKNKDIGGVTGFGTEHYCRDWETLMEWTRTWEGWEQDPREGEEVVHKMHGHEE